MNLITPLSLFIFTFKLGLAIPVNDERLNPLVDDEYPMVIKRHDSISDTHSGSQMMTMMKTRGRYLDDRKSSDEIVVTTMKSPSTDEDEIQLASTTLSPFSSLSSSVDGFKLGQSQIVNDEVDDNQPNQNHLHHHSKAQVNDGDQQSDKINVTNQLPSESNDLKITESPPPPPTTTTTPTPTISQTPSTINPIVSKINSPETSDLPEIIIPTTTLATTTTTQSFQDKVNSLIEDSFAQTTKLLIDLEEQIKLSSFNQQIETDYPPLNIFTSIGSSSALPLAYGFKLTASNFLFRPLIKGSSIVSSAVNFHHNTNDDLKSLTDSENLNLDPVNYETLDENANPDNPNSIIGHHSHHWYGNQKQSGIQMQAMIDEVNRIEQNVEVLITELVSNRRYVTAAVFRSLLNYLRRLRISLERLQTRMAIIGVTNSPQGSLVGGSSIGSGITSSVSSIASSVSSSFLPETSSGPLGGSSGSSSFNPIASGTAYASSAIESIRIRMNRVTEEIRTLINRMRLSFSSSPTVSSSSSSSSSTTSSSPSSTTRPPLASSSSPGASRKSSYYF